MRCLSTRRAVRRGRRIVDARSADRNCLPRAMQTIGHRLKALAATHGSNPALISDDHAISFAELAADARRVASALAALGVSKGTRVGILMPNNPDFLRCAFGAWRLGAIVVPINTL